MPLKVHKLREAESVSVPLSMVQRFEQDTHILTMVGSFRLFQCNLASPPHGGEWRQVLMRACRRACDSLLQCCNPHSRGSAVCHLLSRAIMLDCNVKLVRRGSILPSITLSSALATEAYQLPFDPAGTSVFGVSLPALLETGQQGCSERQSSSCGRHREDW